MMNNMTDMMRQGLGCHLKWDVTKVWTISWQQRTLHEKLGLQKGKNKILVSESVRGISSQSVTADLLWRHTSVFPLLRALHISMFHVQHRIQQEFSGNFNSSFKI